ncbi:peptidyl-prolyl cis-trans isomerase FKBP8, partial [Caerostris extrusa]
MTEIEQSGELCENLSINMNQRFLDETENSELDESVAESYKILSDDHRLENSTSISNSSESFQDTKNIEEETIQNSVSNSKIEPPCASMQEIKENEWLDVLGNGNFKKKGLGFDTRPQRGNRVAVDFSLYVNGTLFEKEQDFHFIVGEMDVIQGIDLIICLMEKEEDAKVVIPSKLAYGSIGRLPKVPPDCEIECDIKLKDVKFIDIDSLSIAEKLKLGNDKRLRGNYFYERGEFLEAIQCYEKAIEYLDETCSNVSTEQSQEIVDTRIKIYNNMAMSHLKLNAFNAALKSVELVLKVQPKNVKALFRKAKILGAQGSTEDAIVCLKLAANLEPNTKIIQVELNKFQYRKKKEDQSQKAMYQRMFPQSPPVKRASFSN